MAARKKKKSAKKPAKAAVAEGGKKAGELGSTTVPPTADQETITQLRGDLERVNATLTKRNQELEAARAVADRVVFKDVVVLSAILDAKAYLMARGGVEAALIIQRISNLETKLGQQATDAAVVLQKVKVLTDARIGGREIFPEELDSLFLSSEKLL